MRVQYRAPARASARAARVLPSAALLFSSPFAAPQGSPFAAPDHSARPADNTSADPWVPLLAGAGGSDNGRPPELAGQVPSRHRGLGKSMWRRGAAAGMVGGDRSRNSCNLSGASRIVVRIGGDDDVAVDRPRPRARRLCGGARQTGRQAGDSQTRCALKSYSHIQVTVATRQCALVGKKQRRGPSADDCNLSGRTDCAAGPEGDELGEDRVVKLTSLVVMNKVCGMKGARWRAGFFLIVRVCSWACKRRKN